MLQPAVIMGGKHEDKRGIVSFINDFDMSPVKRFYTIYHPDTTVIRAWQGHQIEQKWFVVLEGSFEIALVNPDNWIAPSPRLPVQLFKLSAAVSQVLHIPGGYASGFKAIAPHSRMIVYSNLSLQESADDDFRFDQQLWHTWQ